MSSMRLAMAVAMAVAASPAATGDDFAHDVVPVLRKHCVPCHGGEKREGRFSINTRSLILDAGVVVPGNLRDSRLVELIRSADPEDQMPPKDRPRLSSAEIGRLERWVEGGLAWEAGFTFAAALPPPAAGRDHPVDRLVDAYLAARNLPAPPYLEDAAFMRRVYFDLIGLPPTPEEQARFLADRDPGKRDALIDDLLARDQAYAEHWMTFWSDLLRNAYSGTGYIDGGRKQITGWLYAALEENVPYDRFMRELIVPSPASEGFIRGIQWRGDVNASQSREVQFAQSISQVFLGINMKCASCHDSFIDRWTLGEAYGLAAVYSERPLEIFRCDQPTGTVARAAWIFPELGTIDAGAPQPERLEQLAALMVHPENGRVSRTIANRLWRQLMGRGIVHPVDAMHTEPWSEDVLDYLAAYLVDHGQDLKKLLRLIATSRAYQSQAVMMAEELRPDAAFTGPVMKRLTAEQYLDTIWMITGTWPAPDDKAFKIDGRGQGGQLAAILATDGAGGSWDDDRPVRAVLTPQDPLQASLGRPNREQIVTARPDLLTTLEAIHLANGPELADALARGAAKLLERPGGDRGALVDWLYTSALGRGPSDGERRVALELLASGSPQEGMEDLLWTLFMLPEFHFVQ